MEQIQRKRRQAGTLGKYFYVFILPAFIVYLLFSIVPFLYTFYYSFTDYTDMNPVNLSFVGLKNYIKVFNTPLMMTAIKNSVIYAIMLTSLPCCLCFVCTGAVLCAFFSSALSCKTSLIVCFMGGSLDSSVPGAAFRTQ